MPQDFVAKPIQINSYVELARVCTSWRNALHYVTEHRLFWDRFNKWENEIIWKRMSNRSNREGRRVVNYAFNSLKSFHGPVFRQFHFTAPGDRNSRRPDQTRERIIPQWRIERIFMSLVYNRIPLLIGCQQYTPLFQASTPCESISHAATRFCERSRLRHLKLPPRESGGTETWVK